MEEGPRRPGRAPLLPSRDTTLAAPANKGAYSELQSCMLVEVTLAQDHPLDKHAAAHRMWYLLRGGCNVLRGLRTFQALLMLPLVSVSLGVPQETEGSGLLPATEVSCGLVAGSSPLGGCPGVGCETVDEIVTYGDEYQFDCCVWDACEGTWWEGVVTYRFCNVGGGLCGFGLKCERSDGTNQTTVPVRTTCYDVPKTCDQCGCSAPYNPTECQDSAQTVSCNTNCGLCCDC